MTAPNGWPNQYIYATTFQNRLAQITNTTIRNRVFLSMLQMRNRIMGADGGAFLEWEVLMANPKPRGFGGEILPEYNAPDEYRTARLGWAAYHHGLKLDRLTVQMNKGKQAFINVVSRCVKSVEDSFKDRWPEYFYQNGDSPPGNEPRPMQGFYTIFDKYVASTSATYQGYQGKVRLVSGSYATLTMDLGTDSSDWAGPDGYDTVQTTTASLGVTAGQKWWPEGRGDPGYDYWHPLIVNTTASAWGASPAFDTIYCEKQLDFAYQYSARVSQGGNGPINFILCGTTPMLIIRERFQSTYRTLAELVPTDPRNGPAAGANGMMPSMPGRGYGSPIYNYSGLYLCTDFDMPNTTDLIGVNLENVSYHPLHSYNQASGSFPLMEPHVSETDGGSHRLIGAFSAGQIRFDPRNMVCMKPLD